MGVPPPPGPGPKCANDSAFLFGGCGTGCWTPSGGGINSCCHYKVQQQDGTTKDVPICGVNTLAGKTVNPFPSTPPDFGPGFSPALRRVRLAPIPTALDFTTNNGQQKNGNKMKNGCAPSCGCEGSTTYDANGNPVYSSAPPISRTPVCWAAAGASAVVGAGATVPLTIAIANYSSLQPRKLTVQVADPANAGTDDVAALVNVDSVFTLGRNILGSAAGINAQAISSDADNGLVFGGSLPPITAANTIVVTVTNNGGVPLRISTVVEGSAYQ